MTENREQNDFKWISFLQEKNLYFVCVEFMKLNTAKSNGV